MKYYSAPSTKRNGLKPPALYEYNLDNFWFKTVDLENEKINTPLKGNLTADIAIIGGGYTGLSSAYNLRKKFPDKEIILLEGACCGYGASGRNGGFCIANSLLDHGKDPDARKKSVEVSLYGLNQIKECIDNHGLDCDFEENGMLDIAYNDAQIKIVEEEHDLLKQWGYDVEVLTGKDLEKQIKSPRFLAGLSTSQGAILNPAKLARGMKQIVEKMGVKIFEQSVVTRVNPGKTNRIDTELGEIRAPAVVIATNAYSHKIGFFKNRVYPIYTYVVATEPLTDQQWNTIGWQNRQGVADYRAIFNYMIPSVDGRIIIGGSDVKYYANDDIAPGNNKSVSNDIYKDLIATFPPLKGIKIDYAWGGPTAGTLDFTPSVGIMGEHNNIFYGVGFNEGVPSTQTAGKIIADLIAGESNQFTSHFIVHKNIPYAGPKPLRAFFGALKKKYMTSVIKNSGNF